MCRGLAILPATCLKSAKDIKHKIGFLLQKPDLPPDEKQVKDNATASKRPAVPPPAEVEKWKKSFNNLMANQDGRAVFTEFLKSEFSQENIEFWNACEKYKKVPVNKMPAEAKQIYDQYVEADSPNEVNLDAASREETRQNLSTAGPSCFDEAQKKIFTLMEKDSYRRFLCSKTFQKLCPPGPGRAPAPVTTREVVEKWRSQVSCSQAVAGGA